MRAGRKGKRRGNAPEATLWRAAALLLALLATAPLPAAAQPGDLIFADGFESGDLSAWSAVVVPPPDTQPPLLAFTAPDPSTATGPLPQIDLSYSDDRSGVDPATLEVTVDEVDLLPGCTVEATSASCVPAAPLAVGSHTAAARLSDRAGNEATASLTFEVAAGGGDAVPPVVVIDSPAALDTYARSFELVARYFDDASGVDPSSFAAAIDGVDVTASCVADAVAASCVAAAVDAGTHTVGVSVRDLAGNLGSAAVTFEVLEDLDPPQLGFLLPGDGAELFNQPAPRLVATFSDAGSGVDPASLAVEVDGTAVTASCAVDIDAVSCRPSLAPGLHSATMRLADRLGNTAMAERMFTLVDDLAPPLVTIVEPAGGALEAPPSALAVQFADGESAVDTATFRLLLDAVDLTGSCTVGGVGASCPAPPLTDGTHHLMARLDDRAGNRGEADLAFTLGGTDVTPPELTVVSPAAVELTSDATPRVELAWTDAGDGVDPASLIVQVDGMDLTAGCQLGADGASCEPPPLAAGGHLLFVELHDLAGNRTVERFAFDVALALQLAIDAPVSGSLTRDGTVDVTGTLDPAAESVRIGDVEGSVAGGAFTVAGVPLVEGANTLTVVAASPEGGVGMATVTVVRDTQAPRVVIRMPPDGLVTTAPQLAVTGEVADPSSSSVDTGAPTVLVNGVAAEVEQRSFMVHSVLLQPGENVLRATATDDAGNVGTTEVTVTFLPDAERKIEEMLGNGQSAVVGERVEKPLIVRVSDALDRPLAGREVRFAVTTGDGVLDNPPQEGREVTALTDDFGLARAGFRLGHRSGSGNHEVTVTSPGIPGEVVFCLAGAPTPPVRIKRVLGDNQLGAEAALIGAPSPNPLLVQVFDVYGNPVPGVEVTYEVERGGGSFDGLPFTTATTDAEGRAGVRFTLGPEPGVSNNLVAASFDGLTEAPARFTLSGLAPGPEGETRLSGVVLDNADDPVPGVTLRIKDTTLETVAAADGSFTFTGVPAGTLHLLIDGSTAQRPGVWPNLAFKMTAFNGQDNNLGKAIRLLPLDVEGGATVGGDEDVTLHLAGVPGAELTVFAHSVTFPDGSHEGLLTFTQVHSDKVPMEAPMGSDFMLAWTLQPPGTHFDPPARVSIPNNDLPPGTMLDFFSFDHDVGEFVSVGTASVTADGRRIVSDPGFGIVKAGWHGALPPPPPTGGACSPSSCTVCPPGGPPEPKCGDCASCTDGVCDPQSIDDLHCEANGESQGDLIVGVDQDVDFRAIADGDCASPKYEWDFGDGETAEGPTASHAYEEEGDYDAALVASCDCPSSSAALAGKNSRRVVMPIRVRKVDLILQDLPEEDMSTPNEEDPGGWIPLDNDDDDENEKPDLEDMTAGAEEDELIELVIDLADDLDRGEVRLQASAGGNRIKVWKDAMKSERIDLPKTWSFPGDAVPDSVFVEGIEASQATSDVELTLTYTPTSLFGLLRGEPIEDTVKATVVEIDVDVDSDNNQRLDKPARSEAEDRHEDYPDGADRIGKIVVVNDNNDDYQAIVSDPPGTPMPTPMPRLVDTVTDFADGYDLDGMANTGDDLNDMEHFVPLVIELSKGVDVGLARLRFKYESSDPSAVTTVTPVPGLPEFVEYRRPAGKLRLWTKDGDVRRNATPVGMGGGGGDWIVTDPTWFFASELGFSSAVREKTFYVEAIRPSSDEHGDRVTVELDPDGEGELDFIAVDTVRLTSVEIVLFDGAEQVHGAEVAWVTGAPRMPQLAVHMDPAVPSMTPAQWRLETRFNRDAEIGGLREDVVQVPVGGGWFTFGPEDSWDLVPYYPPKPDPMDPGDHQFFGGEAVLSARFGSVGGVGFENKLQFRIRGMNPEDMAARTYIDAHDMRGGNEYPYAYAIARHESRDGAFFYNQFEPNTSILCLRRNAAGVCTQRGRFLTGVPKKGPPDGWGLFQLDVFGPGSATVQQVWNWQANLREAIRLLDQEKHPVAVHHLAAELMNAGGVAPPDRAADTCRFSHMRAAANNCGRVGGGGAADGLDCNYTDALTIKGYNGRSRPVAGNARSRGCTAPAAPALDPLSVGVDYLDWDDRATCAAMPGCTPMTPLVAGCMPPRPDHACGTMEHWDFGWRNIDCVNYVDAVCSQMGPP